MLEVLWYMRCILWMRLPQTCYSTLSARVGINLTVGGDRRQAPRNSFRAAELVHRGIQALRPEHQGAQHSAHKSLAKAVDEKRTPWATRSLGLW